LKGFHKLLKAAIIAASLVSLTTDLYGESSQQATIAIIIDDLGHHYDQGSQLASLPYPLTLAVLPKRRYSKKLLELAQQNKKEVMLHAPMETSHGFQLGKGALTASMSRIELQRTLQESFAAIPGAKGFNNHMGSALTSNKQAMHWVMQAVNQRPYYFVDSRTTAQSIAAKVAKTYNIPTLTRDVFLDHDISPSAIDGQFKKLIEIAKKNGSAIAIGHPHQVTIDFLKDALPKLDELGIALATVSALWQIRHPSEAMYAEHTQAYHSNSLSYLAE
jgi:hypothetical protein